MRSSEPVRRSRGLIFLAAVLVALFGTSCGLFSKLLHHGKDPAEATAALSLEVMRLADQVLLSTNRAGARLSIAIGTPEAKQQTLSWSVYHTDRVLAIAANPNPAQALVDLYFFVSVQRILHEKYWVPEVYHDADQEMLEAYQRIEDSCWQALVRVFDEPQRDQLKQLIDAWQEENPDLRAASLLETPSVSEFAVRKKPKGSSAADQLLGLLAFDPMAGLEPAVREVAVMRQWGERVFFFARHLPQLTSKHAELLALHTVRLPEVQQGLAQSERISRASEELAATAAGLPKEVHAEREETLRQIADELTAQRNGLVANLEEAEGPLRSMLTESERALAEGRRLTESLTELVGPSSQRASATADARNVGDCDEHGEDNARASTSSGGDAARDARSESSASNAPAKRPFDVREYGDAAERIGMAARELTTAVGTIDQDLPRATTALDEAEARVERSIDHAYSKALALVLWSVVAIAAAAAILRVLFIVFARRESAT